MTHNSRNKAAMAMGLMSADGNIGFCELLGVVEYHILPFPNLKCCDSGRSLVFRCNLAADLVSDISVLFTMQAHGERATAASSQRRAAAAGPPCSSR